MKQKCHAVLQVNNEPVSSHTLAGTGRSRKGGTGGVWGHLHNNTLAHGTVTNDDVGLHE